jgi:hypothetical protein
VYNYVLQTIENQRCAIRTSYILFRTYSLQTFSLAEMVAFFEKKFPQIGTFHVLRSLTWFEDAEKDQDPDLFEKVSWQEVKSVIKIAVNAYLKAL